MVYHVQLAICHACTAIQRKPALLHCSPSEGLLSRLTNKNQTLLFPADNAAPNVGCQLPLKQQEHQGTLQESGTTPAAPILPGNLYKALFARYILISGSKPTWANYHSSYPSCTEACLTYCLYCFTKCSPCKERLTICRREQHFGVESFLAMIYFKGKACLLPLQHSLYHTHTHTQKGSFKNLKPPLSLHGYQLCDKVNLISLTNNTHSPFFPRPLHEQK